MKHNVVIDCDPGIDDSLALLVALNNPNIDVLAITIVAGNVPVDKGYENALKILELTGRKDIPVYKGDTSSMYISAEDTHGKNGIGNYNLPFDISLALEEEKMTASEALSFYAERHYDLEVLAIGPLTNISAVMHKDLTFIHNVKRIVCMGGCYKSYGNCTPVSEYNFWCDPVSAEFVFNEMRKLRNSDDENYIPNKFLLVSLDVTRPCVLDSRRLNSLKTSPYYSVIEGITNFYMDFHKEHEGIEGCVINDPVAVYALLDRYITSIDADVYVYVSDDVCRGQSVVDAHNFYKKRCNAEIVTEINTDLFFEWFKDTLKN